MSHPLTWKEAIQELAEQKKRNKKLQQLLALAEQQKNAARKQVMELENRLYEAWEVAERLEDERDALKGYSGNIDADKVKAVVKGLEKWSHEFNKAWEQGRKEMLKEFNKR